MRRHYGTPVRSLTPHIPLIFAISSSAVPPPDSVPIPPGSGQLGHRVAERLDPGNVLFHVVKAIGNGVPSLGSAYWALVPGPSANTQGLAGIASSGPSSLGKSAKSLFGEGNSFADGHPFVPDPGS